MTYVDGFVVPVPTAEKEAYRAFCHRMHAIFQEYGAIEVVDCWGDDVPAGVLTSFPLAVKLADNETACFGWATWASRAARDEAWGKVMADPRVKDGPTPPFDGKRMIYGGFERL